MIQSILDLNHRLSYSFPSQSALLIVVVGLEKESIDRGFENFEGTVSPSCFKLVARTQIRLLESFQNQIFFLYRLF